MVEDRKYIIEMPDGSKWAVPVLSIAYDRAKSYADEYGGDVQRSLTEDTLPLFKSDDYEIADWAKNNMNWEDIESVAELYKSPWCLAGCTKERARTTSTVPTMGCTMMPITIPMTPAEFFSWWLKETQTSPDDVDYQEGWLNGDYKVEDYELK